MDDLGNVTIAEVDSPQDFGPGQQAEVRRWMVEISLAKKRMRSWRDRSRKLWDLYHGTSVSRKKNSYNALFANTEILGPTVYNTLPTPDTRRRFDQDDPIGKVVSEVIDRCLSFNAETTGFDTEIRADILDMLITGRGISRVRYVPDLVQVGDTQETGIESEETELDHEAQEGEQNEELAWETAPLEHVKWDKYLCGPGRSFKEIPWWGFEHDFTRDELKRRFGNVGNLIPLNGGPADAEMQRDDSDGTYDLFKTAKVWEIWDQDTREVVWVSEAWLKAPLKTEKDPLELGQFFPVVDPIRAIEDSDTFEPTPLYEQYREQADELDRISTRINKLVTALKARAIYDPSLGDQVAELFRGDDNDLIPAAVEIKQLYEAGGIDKAIWFAPIDQIIKVVEALYTQREQCKQVIFELTGIADIMRGSTDAQETYGAQALKTQFGMTRVSRMQRAVQRYIRDLFALQAEVMCGKFSQETLMQMTAIKLPSDAQVMPARTQLMQQAIVAKMSGQQVPPLPPKPVTWDDVMKTLRDDQLRAYRVDIETDSTIAAVQQEDIQDMSVAFNAVTALIEKLWPMVQSGVLPFQAAKELLSATARKFRMGAQLEDAIDAMQPPPPPQDPKAQVEQMKAQIPLQVEKMRQDGKQQEIAADLQADRERAQLDQQTAYAQQHAQAMQDRMEQVLEAQRNEMQQRQEAALEQMRMDNDARQSHFDSQIQILIAAMNNQRAIEVAEMTTGAQLEAAQITAARAGSEKD